MKNSFKDIEAEYKKINAQIQKMKNSSTTSTGGFFMANTEKKYNRVLNSWNDYFIKNKKMSNNIRYINSVTFNVKGDVTKAKDFYTSLKEHQKLLNNIVTTFKNNKDIVENSYITIFLDVFKMVTDTKYISAFKVAYDEYSKNANKVKGSVSDILVMCHQLMISYLYFTMGTLNISVFGAFEKIKNLNNTEKDFVAYLEDTQNYYDAIITNLGFTCIEITKVLENIKNPADEMKKAIKVQNESNEKLAKAKESFDSVELQKVSYELSEESYLEEPSFDKGEEEAVTVCLIVVASIFGLFMLIFGIRRAIYLCGTLKTDISEYIKVDVVTVSMNIEYLKEQLNNTTDPKERKRLQTIIDKQQKFVDKYSAKYQNIADESSQANYEATYLIEEEDSHDEKKDDNSSYDDYDILI